MIAWIMTVMMLLCAMPVTAMAADGSYSNKGTLAQFVINDLMNSSYIVRDMNDKAVANVSLADRSAEYKLCISVIETNGVTIPKKGTFYYRLPEQVKSAENGSNTLVTWVYEEESNRLAFSWNENQYQSSFDATVMIRLGNVYDLYNIAKVGNFYYRLAKTTIQTDRILSKSLGAFLTPEEYTMPAYDFTNLTVTIEGKDYIYECEENEEKIKSSGRYYTVKFDNLNVVKKKIGAMNGSTPRWLVPEEQRYDDPNDTDSFHANYTITLHEEPYEQDLYNMIKIDNGDNYYRLKKTRIIAKDPHEYKNAAVIPAGSYTLVPDEEYDFTNLVLTLNGESYVYSDHQLEGDYTSYYMVRYQNIVRQERINGKADWYTNPIGWLDGSQKQYGSEPNEVIAYHRNYIATLYKGTIETYMIEVREENNITAIQSTEGSAVELPQPDERKGYDFVGWNTSEDGSGETYNEENQLTASEDTTLYPVWEEASYLAVEVHSNVENDPEVYDGTEIILTATPIGFEGIEYSIRWEYETKDGERVVIPGAESLEYRFIVDAENYQRHYYVILTPIN